MDTNRILVGLNPLQADGTACVVCGRSYIINQVPNQPVGRSEKGSQVFACEGPCFTIARRRQEG